MRVDVHQHFWTAPLLDRLAARTALPWVRHRDGLTVLHCAGEQPYVIDVPAEAPESHAELVRRDGIDLALVAISSPVGIEALPRDSALGLIEAHLDGVRSLPSTFAPWGPVALDGVDADDVDALLASGCVGVSLPAGALAGPHWLERVGPVLERAAAQQAPLLVHPGPAPGQAVADASLGEPLWWRALTDYVAQMQAAWLTFASRGRREHPDLVVIFAMLAGGAPLLSERLTTRGGPPVELADPRIFYDTSSYGPAAVGAMARLVGEAQLVYGSDRPVIEPIATDRDSRLQANGGGLIAALGAAA
jgi:predicted TIM-barrel fold metal-dependent hydrolase